jgi:hypothetical protein
VRLFPSDGRHLSCHTSYPVCTPRPSQLLVVVGFGLLWRAERLRSLYEKPPIILPELASARRYLSILYNNAWLDACTRHTFLSVRADVDFACRRVLSTTSPTSLDRLQTIGDGRGVETDPQILIALESPCLSPTVLSETPRPAEAFSVTCLHTEVDPPRCSEPREHLQSSLLSISKRHGWYGSF